MKIKRIKYQNAIMGIAHDIWNFYMHTDGSMEIIDTGDMSGTYLPPETTHDLREFLNRVHTWTAPEDYPKVEQDENV